MIARFAPNKRHDLLLNAFSRLKSMSREAHLVFAGEILGPPGYFEFLPTQIKKLSLTNNVSILGFHRDVTKLLSIADALVLCSNREPLGLCVIEAMAAGVPVIVSDSGGTHEIVKDGETGFVIADGDAVGLSERLGQVLHDKGLAARFSAAAREYVMGHLSAHKHASQVMALYDKIISDRRTYEPGRTLTERSVE